MIANNETMEKIVALCKNRGFVYSGNRNIRGLANTWDYGPLGVEEQRRAGLVEKIRGEPAQHRPGQRDLNESRGLGASGHVTNFNDP